jgi:hypothetical protein
MDRGMVWEILESPDSRIEARQDEFTQAAFGGHAKKPSILAK